MQNNQTSISQKDKYALFVAGALMAATLTFVIVYNTLKAAIHDYTISFLAALLCSSFLLRLLSKKVS